MRRFADEAEVNLLVVSGVLRVSIRAKPTLVSLLLGAAAIIGFTLLSLLAWRQSAVVVRAAEILGIASAVFAWFQQLSGSEEEIELGERGIRISRDIFGWPRVSEFPIEQCTDLDIQNDKEDPRRLKFRLGKWRTVEFGNYMSTEQAEKVLDTLADSLPEVAQKLLPSLDITKHWTTLNLN